MSDVGRKARIIWFCDLDVVVARPELIAQLRDEVGLTTIAPESGISHTSGFAPSAAALAASPVENWRSSPTLALHRTEFGVREPKLPAVPGIVSGFDERGLLAVLEAARAAGVEVWGHAGLWSYGGEVFPQLEVRDLFGRPLGQDTIRWGRAFCPSQPELHAWIVGSIVDVVTRYDLDGLFLDHARFGSPAFLPGVMTCGCEHCAEDARGRGYDLEEFRAAFRQLQRDRTSGPTPPWTWPDAGDWASFSHWFHDSPIGAWLQFRSELLADRLGDILGAAQAAARADFDVGTDVLPPSVAIFAGQSWRLWARSATYFTGGFGDRIGWPTARAAFESELRGIFDQAPAWLATDRSETARDPLAADGTLALGREISRARSFADGRPVYPPIAGVPNPSSMELTFAAIVDGDLDGGLFTDLHRFDASARRAVRNLAEMLGSKRPSAS